MAKKNNKIIGGILLISGTAIGAGMLALPVETGPYGFIPSAIILTICWLATLFASLYMLEANMWLSSEANLISMAEETLGTFGKILAWVSYLLLLYTLMVAYLSGMNSLITSSLHYNFEIEISKFTSSLILIGIFGFILYIGTRPIDILNRIFVIGMGACFFSLVFALTPHVDLPLLKESNFHNLWSTLPVLVTTFGYQIVIPSVRRYLESDTRQLVFVIVIGSTIPLFVYLLWNFVILGVIPTQGAHGLEEILVSGDPAVELTNSIQHLLQVSWISSVTKLLSFFVIATSFIGVSLSLFDFLCDGFHIKRNQLNKIPIALATFIPPVIIALTYENVFMAALGYAGILVSVLLIILPVMMVVSGRYFRKVPQLYRTPGGIFTIVLLLIFAIAVIVLELINKGQ